MPPADMTDKQSCAIHVNEQDSRQVLVTDQSEDRFVLSCAEAVRTMKTGMSVDLLTKEIEGMIRHAVSMLQTHGEEISECYLMPRQAELTFFVVPKSGVYDFELAEFLTDLDIEIAEKFQLVPSGVQQIPPDNIGIFVSKLARQYPLHGTTGDQPSAVGA